MPCGKADDASKISHIVPLDFTFEVGGYCRAFLATRFAESLFPVNAKREDVLIGKRISGCRKGAAIDALANICFGQRKLFRKARATQRRVGLNLKRFVPIKHGDAVAFLASYPRRLPRALEEAPAGIPREVLPCRIGIRALALEDTKQTQTLWVALT